MEIEKLQDEFYCDLDPDYLVGDVFSDGSAVVAVLTESPERNGSNTSVLYRTYSSSSKRKASDILPELHKFHKNSQRRARRSSIWITDNNGNHNHINHDHSHPDDHNGNAFSHPPRLPPSIGKKTVPKDVCKNADSFSPELAASNCNGTNNNFEIAESDDELLGDVRHNAEFELPPPERTYASIDPHKPPSPQSADKHRGSNDGHALTNGSPIAESTPYSVSLNSVPLPELSPRRAVSPIASPSRKNNAQVPLPGKAPFDPIKSTPKLTIQSRTSTTESVLAAPVPNDKHKAIRIVPEKSKVSSTSDASPVPVASDKKAKSTTVSDQKKTTMEPKFKKTNMKPDTTPTKTVKSTPKTATTNAQDVNTVSTKEASKKLTKITTKVPTAPVIVSPITHSNPKTATAINLMPASISTQPGASPQPIVADVSSKSPATAKTATPQSSLGVEKKIPVKISSTSKVTKTVTKSKAKPVPSTPKSAKTTGLKKKIKSSELVTASDEEDEVDIQPAKTLTNVSSLIVASVSSKSKPAGAKTTRSLVPASKFDLFNLDSSIISDSDSDSNVYDSVTNSIKPISKPSINNLSSPSKPSTQPTIVEGIKHIKSSIAANTASTIGSAKDPKLSEKMKDSKSVEPAKLVNKAGLTKEPIVSETLKKSQSETKKNILEKSAKETAESKITNPEPLKELKKIVTTTEAKPSESVQTNKKGTSLEVKKTDSPKEIAKSILEETKPEAIKKSESIKKPVPIKKTESVKKPESIKKTEPVKKSEPIGKIEPVKKSEPIKKIDSVKKPDPIKQSEPVKKLELIKEAATLETKPAEQIAKQGKTSVEPLVDKKNSKPVMDSSDSESESEDDDGSDIPSSPEPKKRLVAVNTPSITKSNNSQASSKTSSFMDLLEKKSVTDSVAPVTNSIVGTGNILAELQEKPVEKLMSQPAKRIAGMQSLSALAKRAIPEVHDSTSSKIQSQKTKAVARQPVVEVSSDESSSDDDSDDDSDDSDSDDDSDDDEPKVKIGGRKDLGKKSKNRGFMGMIKSAKRV